MDIKKNFKREMMNAKGSDDGFYNTYLKNIEHTKQLVDQLSKNYEKIVDDLCNVLTRLEDRDIKPFSQITRINYEEEFDISKSRIKLSDYKAEGIEHKNMRIFAARYLHNKGYNVFYESVLPVERVCEYNFHYLMCFVNEHLNGLKNSCTRDTYTEMGFPDFEYGYPPETGQQFDFIYNAKLEMYERIRERARQKLIEMSGTKDINNPLLDKDYSQIIEKFRLVTDILGMINITGSNNDKPEYIFIECTNHDISKKWEGYYGCLKDAYNDGNIKLIQVSQVKVKVPEYVELIIMSSD
jgi:hypothetical protein